MCSEKIENRGAGNSKFDTIFLGGNLIVFLKYYDEHMATLFKTRSARTDDPLMIQFIISNDTALRDEPFCISRCGAINSQKERLVLKKTEIVK
jgi:hypothetical protein